MKNCYITHAEVFSPLGYGLDVNFRRMKSGESALEVKKFRSTKKAVYCATMEESLIDGKVDLQELGAYTKLEKLCIATLQLLLKEAEVDITGKETILILCTTKGNIDMMFEQPEHIPESRILFGACAGILSQYFGMTNKPIVVSNACISGVEGLILGKQLIEAGLYNNAIIVAADLVTEFTVSGFYSLNAYSKTLCTPFDKKRGGVNLGECCAAVMLQSEIPKDKAAYKIAKAAVSNDANHTTAPARDARGLCQAIELCLEGEKESPDFISAHGTGTKYNDAMESLAFYKSGLHDVPFYSLKGYLGHTLGAAGLVETAIALKSLEENVVLESLGFEEIGEDIKLAPHSKTQEQPLRRFLKTASGFGGGNACILVEKI